MFKCELCGQEMLKADGCLCTKIKYNGKIYDRIRFGEEFDLYAETANEGYRCGKENHPVTHLQMLDYELVDEFINE